MVTMTPAVLKLAKVLMETICDWAQARAGAIRPSSARTPTAPARGRQQDMRTSWFFSSPLLAALRLEERLGLLQLGALFLAELGGLQVQFLQGLHHQLGHGHPHEPLLVGRYDEPGGVGGAGGAQAVLV